MCAGGFELGTHSTDRIAFDNKVINSMDLMNSIWNAASKAGEEDWWRGTTAFALKWIFSKNLKLKIPLDLECVEFEVIFDINHQFFTALVDLNVRYLLDERRWKCISNVQ